MARFCLTKSTASLLVDVVPRVIARAYNYGFTVLGVVSDGASENRAAMESLATIEASRFITPMLGRSLSVSVDCSSRKGVVKTVLGPHRIIIEYSTANEEGMSKLKKSICVTSNMNGLIKTLNIIGHLYLII